MRLLHNARFYTFDPDRPIASALLVDGDRIVRAGGQELADSSGIRERQDLGGMVVLPGLTDAHLHLQEYARSLQVVECELDSKAGILQRIIERAGATAPGEWVRGHGWDQNTWGGDWPSKTDLDRIAPHHPVYLTAKSLHVSWVNSRALQLAGVEASTPDPRGGRLQRDERGEPTGLLFESAVSLVERVIPEPSPATLAEQFRHILPKLCQLGLTGVHDFDRRTCFQALEILAAAGELKLRVVKSIPLELLSQAVALGLRSGFGDSFLRIGAVKLFADGALGPHTGALLEPYVDEPQNRGILALERENLFEYGRQAAQSGLSLAVHAIGDRAVREVLDGFALLRTFEEKEHLPRLRHRMEHVQTIHPDDAGRLAQLDIVASMQPSHAPSDMDTAEKCLGERCASSYAWRLQIQAGARLAFGSDAPVESPNPFLGLHAAVTRRRLDGRPGPEGWIPAQRLSVREALEGFTLGPAYAAGQEDRLGRLKENYMADLVVVPIDPFECDPTELSTLRPIATMVAGEWTWQA